jgi:hypothetical protein
MAKRRKKLE